MGRRRRRRRGGEEEEEESFCAYTSIEFTTM
jgi:hypothetical protein